MTTYSREHIDAFWEGVDELLNAGLFAVIGLQLLVIGLTPDSLVIQRYSARPLRFKKEVAFENASDRPSRRFGTEEAETPGLHHRDGRDLRRRGPG